MFLASLTVSHTTLPTKFEQIGKCNHVESFSIILTELTNFYGLISDKAHATRERRACSQLILDLWTQCCAFGQFDIQQGTFYYTLLSDVLITIVSGIPDRTQKSAAQCFNQIADRTRTIRNSPGIVVLKCVGLSVTEGNYTNCSSCV